MIRRALSFTVATLGALVIGCSGDSEGAQSKDAPAANEANDTPVAGCDGPFGSGAASHSLRLNRAALIRIVLPGPWYALRLGASACGHNHAASNPTIVAESVPGSRIGWRDVVFRRKTHADRCAPGLMWTLDLPMAFDNVDGVDVALCDPTWPRCCRFMVSGARP